MSFCPRDGLATMSRVFGWYAGFCWVTPRSQYVRPFRVSAAVGRTQMTAVTVSSTKRLLPTPVRTARLKLWVNEQRLQSQTRFIGECYVADDGTDQLQQAFGRPGDSTSMDLELEERCGNRLFNFKPGMVHDLSRNSQRNLLFHNRSPANPGYAVPDHRR